MATVSLMDLGVLLLIGLTAALANGKDVSQRREMESAKLSDFRTSSEQLHGRVVSHTESSQCPECEPSKPRKRAKRCTCYTYKDKECVYYCHLDIIWINTPEHTVPYGMSSYRGVRARRSTPTKSGERRVEAQRSQRCVCSLQTDPGCSRFCMDRKRVP